MKVVRFLRAYRMYQPGETAGFDDTLADDLIARGTAADPDRPRREDTATPDFVVDPASYVKASENNLSQPTTADPGQGSQPVVLGSEAQVTTAELPPEAAAPEAGSTSDASSQKTGKKKG